MNKVVI